MQQRLLQFKIAALFLGLMTTTLYAQLPGTPYLVPEGNVCPTAGGTITGAPTGAVCGGNSYQLGNSYTDVDSYAWSANNGASFDDATSATPIITLPSTNVNVTVNLVVTKAGCSPTSVNATPITIDVDAPPTVNITGNKCYDVEQTDYAPVDDPLADRQATPDDFTNRVYTVGTTTGATSFSWTWLSNPGNHGTINSGATTHTADISFNKTLAAAGNTSGGIQTYVLQVELGGLTCGTLIRTYTITVQDRSCYCATAVVPFVSATGETWMDRNLGATREATAVDDHLAYGCLFQWGRGNDGHADIEWTSSTAGTPVNGTTNIASTTDDPGHSLFITTGWRTPLPAPSTTTLWQGVNGTNNPCPTGYRIPTRTEYSVESSNVQSLSGNTSHTSFFTYFKQPAGPSRSALGPISATAGYWTSTPTSAGYAYQVRPKPSFNLGNHNIRNGYSIRCIKD